MVTRLRALIKQPFFRDTLTLQAGQLLLMLIAGGTQAIIARTLQKDLLGFYRAILVQFALFSLVNISGVALVGRNQLAKAFGTNDDVTVRRTVGWMLKTSFVFNGVLAVIFFFLYPLLTNAPNGGPLERWFGYAQGLSTLMLRSDSEVGLLARWLVLTALADIPYALLQNLLAARRTMPPLVRLETLRLVILCAAQLFATFTRRVELLIFVQIAVSFVFCVHSIRVYRNLARADPRLPSWSAALRSARSANLRDHLGQGVLISFDKNFSQFTVETLPLLLLSYYSLPELGLFSTAYQVITFPTPLISGIARNLDTYLPFRSTDGQLRTTFIRSTVGSAVFWSFGTLGMAVAGPLLLVILFGFSYLPAVAMLYPLLLQSLAVGFGVGLGSAFRTLGKSHYSILESAILTILILPLGIWLISAYGGYGAAWFVGLQWLLNALAGVGIILWLTRKPRIPVQS